MVRAQPSHLRARRLVGSRLRNAPPLTSGRPVNHLAGLLLLAFGPDASDYF